MRVPIAAAAVVTLAAGGVVWATGTLAEFGSVRGESIDASQRTRVVAPVRGWIGVAKPLGSTMMLAGVLTVGVLWLARR
jgi:hypothetical protein